MEFVGKIAIGGYQLPDFGSDNNVLRGYILKLQDHASFENGYLYLWYIDGNSRAIKHWGILVDIVYLHLHPCTSRVRPICSEYHQIVD